MSTPHRSIWKPFIDTVWHFVFSGKSIQGQQTPSSHRSSAVRAAVDRGCCIFALPFGRISTLCWQHKSQGPKFQRYPICHYVYPWILQGSEIWAPLKKTVWGLKFDTQKGGSTPIPTAGSPEILSCASWKSTIPSGDTDAWGVVKQWRSKIHVNI